MCIVISGPFWTRGWPEWWNWWLNLPALMEVRRNKPWLNIKISSPSVQAVGMPIHHGRAGSHGQRPRTARGQPPASFTCSGRIGNAQIGPIYLGLDWASCFADAGADIAFEIIGFNMLASVNWDPIQFVRQLFWLALEPPPPALYGLSPSRRS